LVSVGRPGAKSMTTGEVVDHPVTIIAPFSRKCAGGRALMPMHASHSLNKVNGESGFRVGDGLLSGEGQTSLDRLLRNRLLGLLLILCLGVDCCDLL
jgi:hypothetical protein